MSNKELNIFYFCSLSSESNQKIDYIFPDHRFIVYNNGCVKLNNVE